MNDVLQKPHPLIASDRLEGTAVRRLNGERIGHVERLMIHKITGSVSYALSVSAASSAWERTCFVFPGGRLAYSPRLEAYELDVTDDELRRAPSFRADKDFDRGDRSKEAELHRYCGIQPYWDGF